MEFTGIGVGSTRLRFDNKILTFANVVVGVEVVIVVAEGTLVGCRTHHAVGNPTQGCKCRQNVITLSPQNKQRIFSRHSFATRRMLTTSLVNAIDETNVRNWLKQLQAHLCRCCRSCWGRSWGCTRSKRWEPNKFDSWERCMQKSSLLATRHLIFKSLLFIIIIYYYDYYYY